MSTPGPGMRRGERRSPASRNGPASHALVLAAGLSALMAAGRGARAAPGSKATPAHAPAPRVALSITIQGASGTRHRMLRCTPDGGSYSDPAAACRSPLALRRPFAPLPEGEICPMIMASGRTATVTGTFFGRQVDVTWPDGGCYLGRRDKLGAIFS